MSKLLIKICGIKDLPIAEQTAKLGADFIGLIFHPDSTRNVNIQQAKLLSHTIKESGAIPVAVFVDQTAAKMQEICLNTDISTVQLHGNISRQQHHLLPENYIRIYVISLHPQLHCDGYPDAEVGNGLLQCNPERDFLLYDHINSGKGNSFDWTQLCHFRENGDQKNYHWFLAGGLNSGNISSALQLLKPNGIDVSSGVENQSGEKDIKLIRKFIQEARQ